MAQKPSFINLESTAITTKTMTGNEKVKTNRSEKTFSSQAHRILDSIKNSPYFLRRRTQNEPQVSKDNLQGSVGPAKQEKSFYVLYKGNVEVRSARIHDAIFGVSQLVTDPTQYAPTSRKGESIQDQYASDLNSVKLGKTDISIEGNGASVRLPLIHLAYCATDLRVPQVVSIVTNINNAFVCYALVCPNRIKANEIVTNINQTFETLWREWKRRERQETQKEDEEKVNEEMACLERQRRSEIKEKSKKK